MAKDFFKGKKILKSPGHYIDEASNSIEEIKNRHNIVSMFKSYGVDLKPTGKAGQYMGLCCFHDDHNPSLSVSETEGKFKCFGCQASGSVIDLVMKKEGLTIKETIRKLSSELDFTEQEEIIEKPDLTLDISALELNEPLTITDEPIPPLNSQLQNDSENPKDNGAEPKSELEPVTDRQSLYQEIVKRYHEALNNKEAINYLEKRGLKNKNNHLRFKIGFCDGSLLNSLSKEQSETLKKYGMINKDGTEFFYNCLVFPVFDDLENVVGFYGRDINDNSGFKHRYLKGKHRSVFNRKASKVFPDSLILTESIIDALSLIELGFDNVQACYGINGFTSEMFEILKDDQVKEIIIAFDNDEAGIKANEGLKEKLITENFKVKLITPPDRKDWNEELINGITAETIKELIEKAKIFQKKVEREEEVKIEKITGGYSFVFVSGEKYEVLNFKEDFVTALKVVLKAENYGRLHCDDFNLYVFRSRENFTKQAEYLTGIPAERGTEQILTIIKKLEEIRNKKLNEVKTEDKEPELTEAEIKTGMKFLTNPKLFDELRSDLTQIGCVGEENAKVLLYLVATSRQRVNPISVYVLGRSSGGKSWLVKTVLKLIPEKSKFIITKVSPEVIYYMEKGLQNKVVMVGEFDGADDIEYILRELVSDGHVSKLVTLKDPETGLPKPQYIVSEGPISLISTSTKPENLNPENLSRCLLMHIDESPEQTQRILEYQRYISSKKGYLFKIRAEEIIKKHHIVQRLLLDVMVFNIFGDELDFPTLLLLARRAHFNFLHVIEMTAFVLQKQHTIEEMEVKGEKIRYIETNIIDYEITYNLMMDGVMENTLDEKGVNSKELHKIMLKMVNEIAEKESKTIDTIYLERQEILIKSGWTVDQIKRNIKPLIEHGYLEVVAGKSQGQRHKYRVLNVKNRIKELLEKIPTPEEMKKRLIAKGKM